LPYKHENLLKHLR